MDHQKLTDTLTLSKMNDGFWLYDKTMNMNLSMRAKTEQAAFINAITYYQKRLTKIEIEYKEISIKVENFIDQFNNDELLY